MNPLKCDEIQNAMIDYLEFELPMSQREQFNDHLTHCSQCRKLHDEMRSVIVNVKAMPVSEPDSSYWDDLPQNVLAEVKKLKGEDFPATQSMESSSNVMPFVPKNVRKGNQSSVQSTGGVGTIMTNGENIEETINPNVNGDEFDNEDQKQRRLITWPKVALPVAAAILVAVGTMFQTNEVEKQDNLFYSPAAFQSSIISENSISTLAQNVSPVSQSTTGFGFANQNTILNTFSLGSMFSETIAYTAGEEVSLLKTHMVLLKTALTRGSVPASGVIVKIDGLLEEIAMDNSNRALKGVARQLSIILDGYAMQVKENNYGHYVLLHVGAWSFDYSLAVVAKDTTRLKQPDRIEYFKSELNKLNAPVGVGKSFDKILQSVKASELTDTDYKRIQSEVNNIRSLLG